MGPALTLLLKVLTAHLLGDFVFQTDRAAKEKKQPGVLARHTGIHAVLLALVVWTEPQPLSLLAPLVVLLILHAATDRWTSSWKHQDLRTLGMDQSIHVLLMVGAVAFARPAGTRELFVALRGTAPGWHAYVYAIGLLVAVWVGSVVVGRWVAGTAARLPAESEHPGLERAGRWIGKVERLLVYAAILLGIEYLVAFVIGAKAILRLPEATEKKSWALAEYYLVGTLTSVAWAVVVAIAVRWIVSRG